MAEKFFITRNRFTQQFLYSHGLTMESQFKDEEYMTNWRYVRTPELERTLQELEMIRARPKNYFELQPTTGNPVTIHNYKIEKFLYLHGLIADRQFLDDDHLSAWEYRNTAALQNLLDEFRRVREEMMKAA